MRARPLLQRDTLALQVRQRLERRVLLHEDGRTVRLGRLHAHVAQVLARRLRKHGRRIAGNRQVQAAGGQRFQLLRPGRKLQPTHLRARKALLQRAVLLDDDEVDRALLKANAQLRGRRDLRQVGRGAGSVRSMRDGAQRRQRCPGGRGRQQTAALNINGHGDQRAACCVVGCAFGFQAESATFTGRGISLSAWNVSAMRC